MKTAERSDVGRIRSVNEDRVAVLPEINGLIIAIVADGMGGHQAGDIASQMTIEKIREELSVMPAAASIDDRKEAVRKAIEAANHKIYLHAEEHEQLRGMGTTVVVAIASVDRLVIGHIGDSRAYLAARDKLVQLTEDHSLVNELVRNGQITEDEAQYHPRRNVLLRALGTEAGITVDVDDFNWEENDILLICSDGLSGLVEDEVLFQVLQTDEALEAKVNDLVDKALEAGGDDNVTAVLIENQAEAVEQKG